LSHLLKLSRSTVSHHLDALERAALVESHWSGSRRYTRLKSPEVAALLEQLAAFAPAPVFVHGPRTLRLARTCYRHLGGALACAGFHFMLQERLVTSNEDLRLTPSGLRWGISRGIWQRGSRPTVGTCLDWTERKPHVSGALGALLLHYFLSQNFLQRANGARTGGSERDVLSKHVLREDLRTDPLTTRRQLTVSPAGADWFAREWGCSSVLSTQ
jgi:hypothetical protein